MDTTNTLYNPEVVESIMGYLNESTMSALRLTGYSSGSNVAREASKDIYAKKYVEELLGQPIPDNLRPPSGWATEYKNLKAPVFNGSVFTAMLYLDYASDHKQDRLDEMFVWCAKNGHIKEAKRFLTENAVNYRTKKTTLKYAASEGRADIVEILYPYVNEASEIGHYLVNAARKGHEGVVKVLLKSSHAAGSIDRALETAIDNSKLEVVRVLIDDGRYDPKTLRDKLWLPLQTGNTAMLRLLLSDTRVVPNQTNLLTAIESGVAASVSLLLQYDNIIPSHEALDEAIIRESPEIISILLANDQVDLER